MMNSARSLPRFIAQFMQDWIPLALRAYEETSKETVQTIVWIVALATGVLSVATLNERLLRGLTPGAARAEIVLLLGTLVLGVVQRVLQHLLNQVLGTHL